LNGDYYRLLTDGSYAIQVKSPGYETQTQYIDVNNKPNENNAQRLDFVLKPTSNERVQLQRMLGQYFEKVQSFVFFFLNIFLFLVLIDQNKRNKCPEKEYIKIEQYHQQSLFKIIIFPFFFELYVHQMTTLFIVLCNNINKNHMISIQISKFSRRILLQWFV